MINLPLGKTTDAPFVFKAGTVIFPENEVSRFLFILKKGEVRLLNVNGQHITVSKICHDKDILNEVSVLTNKPTEFAAIAKTDIELVLIEKKDIQEIIKNGPEWIPQIFATLCDRLEATNEIITEHKLMSGEQNAELKLTKDEEKKYLSSIAEYKP